MSSASGNQLIKTPISRRAFSQCLGMASAAALLPRISFSRPRTKSDSLVAGIDHAVIFNGRNTRATWFHPRACMLPDGNSARTLMTLQSISGSDVFGRVHWTESSDKGKTWSKPEAIEGFGREKIEDGYEVGVCDVVPEYHQPTDSVLAIGHNVYYKKGVLARPQLQRWPVYTVRSADGDWSEPRRIMWSDERATAIYTCGCAQRVTKSNGDLIIPISFGPKGRRHRSVCTLSTAFDGQTVTVLSVGNELQNETSRGLLEPTLARFDDRYFMTIRAEDGFGYVTSSNDGLEWRPQRAWAWDDGQKISMSTTQQRWLVHSDALFLVYTRRAKENVNVFRWRAPLYLARVDVESMRLIRDSERIALPLIGDGINDPTHVARMGNFHTVAVDPNESWITVGETLPEDGWAGDTLLARIRWNKPNKLA